MLTRRILFLFLVLTIAVESCWAFSTASMSAAGDVSVAKHTLYDVPVSNNGARVRIILYKKQIPEHEVTIVSPQSLGGLKDPAYLALNPQGKMPLLTINSSGTSLPESDTICRYLLDEYSHLGPSFQPNHPNSNLIARLHDMYLTTIQGCLYKASPPFGSFGTRTEALREFRNQLTILEDLINTGNSGPYLLGDEVAYADATLFPTMVFAKMMLPKFGIPESEALPPKVDRWYEGMIRNDPDFRKVHDEVLGALHQWDANGRWDTIHLAGLRDTKPPTIFDKIISKDIPSTIVYEDDDVLAFQDINPAAPAHVLVIPKDRANLSSLRMATSDHVEILGKLLVVAGDLVKKDELGFGDGARIVINDGEDAGQEVAHLHVHVLGGRIMTWPPG